MAPVVFMKGEQMNHRSFNAITRHRPLIAHRCRQARKKYGMTLKDVGDTVGVTTGAVSKFEHGVVESYALLLYYVSVLGVDISYISLSKESKKHGETTNT